MGTQIEKFRTVSLFSFFLVLKKPEKSVKFFVFGDDILVVNFTIKEQKKQKETFLLIGFYNCQNAIETLQGFHLFFDTMDNKLVFYLIFEVFVAISRIDLL